MNPKAEALPPRVFVDHKTAIEGSLYRDCIIDPSKCTYHFIEYISMDEVELAMHELEGKHKVREGFFANKIEEYRRNQKEHHATIEHISAKLGEALEHLERVRKMGENGRERLFDALTILQDLQATLKEGK